ncbi:DNA cytosine methyltransferase [Mycolicibacterium fortuitum]|uniref:DNA (cytosine-5-)-methyltransferase n=1 Tax=Mycolicibacterium fortuitum subsp. fortuitum DSM 46621 = ATCC 6841 = JCM 6387 TaxID=1214102 RepID=K0URQ9_MYCFO|nr:DNA cytosine methyltransferase [Mycolicibacterium fortuitum]AIY48216.1 DNA-cytosine methyltransferase [Mycobacterium sp. VKM Ac-1817D]CRL82417.1 DNA-methyltransferase Dcm [Mycolicibacter nonchromogenicus]EJZ09511.1 DNA modification cytosine-specific methyltransferase [Mycolicibacterium fortuitum subsp. fortuitum DSM 46621 = ATCC 6841 = JCM 6387]WEV31864.1 DNA cytosine methyltransferase [Mycolicibacterium fortuitum]CRL58309.1 DNA-methyltransferase Dcm [Mycolicibacterium fortuitum subsp. fort
MTLPKIVSLFSGAGGLDLGFERSGFPLSFAVDLSTAAIQTHRRNFKDTVSVAADLEKLKPAGVLAHLEEILEPGDSIGVIGGPPCQGFSRANTGSAANDPRNRLPLLYLQIVQALQAKYEVEFVLFENVLGIRDAKHSVTFRGILSKFRDIGLTSDVSEYSALDYGVAQTRNRVIISGFREETVAKKFKPEKVRATGLTVGGVIGSLPEPAFFARGLDKAAIPHHENHWTMRPVSKRFSRPGGADRAGRSFRRLEWDKPSPTVAYGHREIHVHPDGHRRLSIYEAMLLQGFPSDFVLEGTLSSQVEQVSNAVPPPLAQALATAIVTAMRQASQPSAVNETLSA